MVILDGASDRPLAEFADRTPLEIARLPNLRALAACGVVGQAQTIPPGCPMGADVARICLLGRDPRQWNPGSGYLEAVGAGLSVEAGSWYLSAGLVTTAEGRLVDPAAGGAGAEEAAALFRLCDRPECGLAHHPLGGSRAVARVSREAWTADVVAQLQLPPWQVVDTVLVDLLPRGRAASTLREAWLAIRERLAEHEVNQVRVDLGENPATDIWWWGAPSDPAATLNPPPFSSAVRGGVVTDSPMLAGLARLAGMEPRLVVADEGQRGYYDERLAQVAEMLSTHDLVIVHAARADRWSRRGAVDAKIRALEGIDQMLIGPLLEMIRGVGDWRVLVTSCFGASVAERRHIGDPVPVLLAGAGIEADEVTTWDEEQSAAGALRTFDGQRILAQLLGP